MSRWISRGPRAVSCSTLTAGLALILAGAGVAPAMSTPEGPDGLTRGDKGANAREADFPILPVALDAPRSGDLSLEAPLELPASLERPPRAIARFEGTPAPGRKVVLRAPGASADRARVRWQQIRGAAVQLDHPTEADASFIVPETDDPLGFLLIVANDRGIESAEVSIPVPSSGRSESPGRLRADAGDDQVGLVGRQITINGMRSEPRSRLAYRWVQTGGPIVRLKIEDGYVYSFVPTVPGIYRFALVVASGGEISEPDEVCVTVGAGTRGVVARGDAASAEPAPTQELARAGLKALKLGAEVAEPLARAFEDTADRMDLYENYAETFAEMSRRLEPILPDDLPQRNRWIRRLFEPLTGRVVEVMRSEGLDFRSPESQTIPLSASQKASLADQFRLIAEGLRSAGTSR